MPVADVHGTRLSYEDTGTDGPPVLLLHAFPLRGEMWAGQLEALGDRFRLIAPDLKGFGDSDAPEDAGDYSMDTYADEVAGLLRHLEMGPAAILGLSMGGYIAFALWRRHRDLIRALILADTRAEADPDEGRAKRTAQQEQVRAEGIGGLVEALPGALLGDTTREKRPDVVAQAKKLMENPDAGYIGALEALKGRPDSTGDLTSINVPTLVLVGEEDGLTPPEAARKIHEHVGGSRLVVIPEAGHLSNLEAPETFNGALAEFLSEL
jgi:3-oxoadipate enol-lactonase